MPTLVVGIHNGERVLNLPGTDAGRKRLCAEGDFVAGDETKPYFVALDAKASLAGNPGDLPIKGGPKPCHQDSDGSGSPALPRLSEKEGRILYSRGENGAGPPAGHGEAVPAVPY